MVSEVRPLLWPETEAASGPPQQYLALGRSLHSNQWPTKVSVACRGSDGDVIHILVQPPVDRHAERFFSMLLRGQALVDVAGLRKENRFHRSSFKAATKLPRVVQLEKQTMFRQCVLNRLLRLS